VARDCARFIEQIGYLLGGTTLGRRAVARLRI
jgi:hypothetical protein